MEGRLPRRVLNRIQCFLLQDGEKPTPKTLSRFAIEDFDKLMGFGAGSIKEVEEYLKFYKLKLATKPITPEGIKIANEKAKWIERKPKVKTSKVWAGSINRELKEKFLNRCKDNDLQANVVLTQLIEEYLKN